jgi:thioredoxin-like negative regulator of GroEL
MSKNTPDTETATEKKTAKELAEKDYEAEVLKSDLPVVLDFYSADSTSCTALAPRFGAVADKFEGKARFLRVSRPNNPGLCEKLSVTASPTLVFFKNGKEFGERLTGDDIKRTALKGLVEAMLK